LNTSSGEDNLESQPKTQEILPICIMQLSKLRKELGVRKKLLELIIRLVRNLRISLPPIKVCIENVGPRESRAQRKLNDEEAKQLSHFLI
jgi:hypothetical protein